MFIIYANNYENYDHAMEIFKITNTFTYVYVCTDEAEYDENE